MRLKHCWRRVADPVVGLAFHLVLATTGCLTYAGLRRVARAFAPAVSAAYPTGRRLVKANLALAFPDWPDDKRDGLLHRVFENASLGALEFFWFTKFPKRLTEHVDLEGDVDAKVLELGRPPRKAVMVTPHLGNWELLGQVAAANGLRLAAVAHRIRNQWIERPIDRARRFHGMEVIPADGAARGMLKTLRSGGSVGVLMDQNTRPRSGGIFVDFFGLPVTVSRGPATLARRCGVEIIVGACVRDRARLTVATAPLPRPVSAYASDAELTQDIIAANEQLIRRWPEQYAWLYKRWRYIPEDASEQMRNRYPFYAKPCEPKVAPRATP